jgi:hypothetical protein
MELHPTGENPSFHAVRTFHTYTSLITLPLNMLAPKINFLSNHTLNFYVYRSLHDSEVFPSIPVTYR